MRWWSTAQGMCSSTTRRADRARARSQPLHAFEARRAATLDRRRPRFETAPARAAWTDATRYDDRANGGAGEIHLAGTVDVGFADAGESGHIEFNELRLGLKSRRAATSRPADTTCARQRRPSPARAANVPAKAIATMTATGDAARSRSSGRKACATCRKLFRVRRVGA